MAKTIEIEFSAKGIENLIEQLETYKDGLNGKCDKLSDELAKAGSETARNALDGSEYDSHITISANKEQKGSASITARNDSYIIREWKSSSEKGGKKTAIVNPVLMTEFGSGQFAVEPDNPILKGFGGRGTFPNQTHADENIWFWRDMENKLHHSSGEKPNRPMHNAMLALMNKQNILKIAQKVFKS